MNLLYCLMINNKNLWYLFIFVILLLLNSCNKDTFDKSPQNSRFKDFQFVASFYPEHDTHMNIRVDCKDSIATITLLPVYLWGYPSFKISSFNINQNDLNEFVSSINTIKKYNFVDEDPQYIGGMTIALYFHTFTNDTVRLIFASDPENKDFLDFTLAIIKLAEKTVMAEPYSLIIKRVKDYLDDKANYLIQSEDPYYVILNETLSTDNLDEYKNLIKNIPNDKQVIIDFRDVWYANDTILNLFKDTKFDKIDTYYLIDSSDEINVGIVDYLKIKREKIFYNYDTLFASIFKDYNNYKYYPYLFNEHNRPRVGVPIGVPDYKEKK